MQFKTQINGIPCTCVVDRYLPGRLDKTGGAFEDAEEGYDEEMDYHILDDRNIRAPWIQAQITDADDERLREEYHTTVLEHKHFYED